MLAQPDLQSKWEQQMQEQEEAQAMAQRAQEEVWLAVGVVAAVFLWGWVIYLLIH